MHLETLKMKSFTKMGRKALRGFRIGSEVEKDT